MKLSNIEKFKGKRVIVEWQIKDQDLESEEGIIEEIEPESLILEYTTLDRRQGVQKIKFSELIFIEESSC